MGTKLFRKGLSLGIFLLLVTSSIVSALYNKQKIPSDDIENIESNYFSSDQPSVLPNWTDDDYHDNDQTRLKLLQFNEFYPNLVSVFSIGKSVLYKDIWCLRITNEQHNGNKYSCLYDGGIHGSEWETTEACLYFAEYLLINFDRNKTISDLLNTSDIYFVCIINPDGRENDNRFNANGIDLNRNFDVHFGRLRGYSLPLGTIFGRPLIKWIILPFPPYFLTNCGRYPFSEPETQVIRDLFKELQHHNFSFYLSSHTAQHYFSRPSNNIIRAEYEISPAELEVLEYAKSWVENNTEYPSAEDNNKYGFGSSVSYCFKQCHIPAFGLEILTPDYDPWFWSGFGKHDYLVHWMNTTLPIFMYLLVNIENLYHWDIPDISPLLPDGVPPPPLNNLKYLK